MLTGGTALLRGVAKFTSEQLELPSRIGTPEGITGLVDAVASPVFSSGVGLVLYGVRHARTASARAVNGNGWLARMTGWLKEMVAG